MTIKDIHEGKIVDAWGDKEFITLEFPFCSVCLPMEDWGKIREDLMQIAEKVK